MSYKDGIKATFSVVVATTDRPELLELCLKSLLNQDYPQSKIELVLINSDEKPVSKKILSLVDKFSKAKVLQKQGVSCGEARNIGGLKGVYDYIVFIDDDAQASSDWLKQTATLIAHEKPQVFGGPIFPYYLSDKPEWFKDSYVTRSHGDSPNWLKNNNFLSGSNLFIHSTLYQKLGGTRKDLGMSKKGISLGEDTELQMRINKLGIQRYYDPNLKVFHYVSPKKMTFNYKIRRVYSLGKSDQFLAPQPYLKIVLKFLRFCMITIVSALKYFTLGSKKYDAWQNYVWENSTEIFYWLGRLRLRKN